MSGNGIVILLSDARPKDNKIDDVKQFIVHDTDILQIINVLRNAGAEAISINGQRITNKTAVTCIGVVIKINDEKVSSPFEIRAIGNQDNLFSAITMIGGIGDILKSYGLDVKLTKEKVVKIPKYNKVI